MERESTRKQASKSAMRNTKDLHKHSQRRRGRGREVRRSVTVLARKLRVVAPERGSLIVEGSANVHSGLHRDVLLMMIDRLIDCGLEKREIAEREGGREGMKREILSSSSFMVSFCVFFVCIVGFVVA